MISECCGLWVGLFVLTFLSLLRYFANLFFLIFFSSPCTGANVRFGNFWRILLQMPFDILVFLLTQYFLNVKLLWLVSDRIWVYVWIPRCYAMILFCIARIIWPKAEALFSLGRTSVPFLVLALCSSCTEYSLAKHMIQKNLFTKDILIDTIVVEEHWVKSPCGPDCTSVWN